MICLASGTSNHHTQSVSEGSEAGKKPCTNNSSVDIVVNGTGFKVGTDWGQIPAPPLLDCCDLRQVTYPQPVTQL